MCETNYDDDESLLMPFHISFNAVSATRKDVKIQGPKARTMAKEVVDGDLSSFSCAFISKTYPRQEMLEKLNV